jgi:hypothetical protein
MPSFQERLTEMVRRPWFSYLALLMLQAKVMWGIWEYKDLASGDTSSYFGYAYHWFQNYTIHIAWSPLYTAFYGSLLHVSTDPYTVTILHRVVIVFAVTIMVLALMRRLLPHSLAWIVSAWWAILPIHFDSLYEVHLFAVIVPLAACLLVAYKPAMWARGCAVAIIACSSFLIRNELVVATFVLAVSYALWEVRLLRIARAENRTTPSLTHYLLSYGLPLVLAAMVVTSFYLRSYVKFPWLSVAFAEKHTVNMCQVYAFGYQQRHPAEWTKSPWLDCGDLIQKDFGSPRLSFFQMIRRNPKAMLEHMLWNTRLTPNGLQVLLFNVTSGSVNPDYVPVIQSAIALPLSGIVIIILIGGMILLYRNKLFWWDNWLESSFMAWITLASLAATAPLIILTQRPRPSYLFTTGIFLTACIGLCSFVIFHRLSLSKYLSSAISIMSKRIPMFVPVILITTIILIPSYYPLINKANSRPLLELYDELAPHKKLITAPGVRFLVNRFAFELQSYLEATAGQPFVWYQLVEQAPPMPALTDYKNIAGISMVEFPKNENGWSMPINEYLDRIGINLIYVDNNLWTSLDNQKINQNFVRMPESVGWKILAFQNAGSNRWMLLQKIGESKSLR